jgi:hypothetical protein
MIPVSESQKRFWEKLVQEKDFPPGSPDPDTLLQQFQGLNKKSGSEWIDKALKLPDKGSENETVEAPPF